MGITSKASVGKALAFMLFSATAFPVCAQVVTYSNRGTFNAAAPGSTLVDFEAGSITTPSTGDSFTGPLNSTTNNSVFSTGAIPAGISFDNSCIATNLTLVGPGFDTGGWSSTGGLPSKGLMPNSDACSLNFQFTTPVYALGLDIFAESNYGYRVSLYGAANALIGHYDGTAGETVAGFLGVVSSTPIYQAIVKAPSGTDTGAFEVIDNVAFNTAMPAPAVNVPTLSTLGLILSALTLLATGAYVVQKRNT